MSESKVEYMIPSTLFYFSIADKLISYKLQL